ncbi:CHAD domain-containing protein [Microvirga sp. ACRRW]|uniref:CYTH and CHAD domain-containing protein n=1 Tax=Microvirga sp. ACRRW TaxID=2918205 RepID=UPI001EF43E3F|nr:CHAD domain-containing protein [Microvirga sp. ACRRW]MCG7392079.1 CHAD domain-containing protein [Microvirga sp. ACRRW]
MMNAPAARLKQSPESDRHPREIELKLELASGTFDDLLAHPALPLLSALPGQSGQLHAIYFDTADHALRREGISLRIRHKNGSTIQTIKAEGAHGSLIMDRGEWETPVNDRLDLSAAAGTPLASLTSDEATRRSIGPIFTIDTDRKAYETEFDGSLIEVSLDRSRVSVMQQEMTFLEIELELKMGSPAALFALARRLSEAAPLRLSILAKSARGYRLLNTASLKPSHSKPIELPKEATCAEAFQIIARSCLSQMLYNEVLVRQTQDPEALHQTRVGLRRLRSALSLFGKQLLTDPESAGMKSDLRWAGQAMGKVRDLDVLLERIRSSKPEYDKSQANRVERIRGEAHRDLLEILNSRRFMETILKAAAWIEAGTWTAADARARKQPVLDFATSELSRRFKRIRKTGNRLRKRSEEERHELRIRIKKLRYGTEFFASLFPKAKAQKRRQKLASLLGKLQDTLGEVHDLAVSGSLVPSLVETAPRRAERRRDKLLDKSKKTAKSLFKIEPFWL